MLRRRAINDVLIAYKPYLLEFMAFYHERVQPYPRETVFEQDILGGCARKCTECPIQG